MSFTKSSRFLLVLALLYSPNVAAQSTHPRDYVSLIEENSDSRLFDIPRSGLKAEIDRRSDVMVRFDRQKVVAAVAALGTGGKVEVRVEASITRAGSTQSSPLPIDNYYVLVRDKSGTVTDVTIIDQAIINNGGDVSGFVPDTILDLTSQALAPGDIVRVRVTNLSTQESVDKSLTARDFGLPREVRDSFLFLNRLDVSAEAPVDGIDNVNFGPAPGVTYSWTVSARRNMFLRAVRPSFGVNVSFTDWDDPAFNQATGQFAAGTNASDIEVATGLVVGVFDGIVQLTYGLNLNVDDKRAYFGVGFSFVNVVDRLGKLIPKK